MTDEARNHQLDFDTLIVLAAVLHERSLTRAGAKLGVPKSTVSRKLSMLERHVGTQLLSRSRHGVTPSEAGAQLLARVAPALAQLRDAIDEASERARAMSGRVRVSVGVDLGATAFGGVVCRFLRAHPGVAVELRLTDTQVDLSAEGIDVAVRVGELRDKSVVARPLGGIAGILVASPSYVRAHGEPERPDDLAMHDGVIFNSPPFSARWRLRGAHGATADVVMRERLVVNSLRLAAEAAIDGVGVARLPLYVATPAVRSGQLVRVLPCWSAGSRNAYIVFASRQRQPARVRAFVEHVLTDAGFKSTLSNGAGDQT
jgi:DNA-binding transcriptional LysR family regulator